MKVLVTGGAGFIGSNFVRRTLAQTAEHEIVVLDALTYAGRRANLAGLEDKIRLVEGDIRDAETVDSLAREVDLIVHFAAESHNDNSLSAPRKFVETNVLGTFELIQAAVKHDVRFHHVSTDEVFGDLPIDSSEKFSRTTPYNPSSPYSASKASSDHLVRAWSRSFGLQATITNCSNNFGPYQHEEKLIPRTTLLAAAGIRPKVYGAGDNVRDWIHVDDHNDGVWEVIRSGEIGETYLLGASNERSNIQVVNRILEILGKDEDFIEFVQDRPGHDRRYAIDASETLAETNWRPALNGFESQLEPVVDYYANLSVDLSGIANSGLSTSLK
jgi:dTDP-glucose 4,6-dehydratase